MRINSILATLPQRKVQIAKQQNFEGSIVPFEITYKVKEQNNPDRIEVVSPYKLQIRDKKSEPVTTVLSKDEIDLVMYDLIKESRCYTGSIGKSLPNFPSKIIKGSNSYKEITAPMSDNDGNISKTKVGSIYYMDDMFEEVNPFEYNYVVRQGWTYKPLGDDEIEITDGYY